MKLRDHDTQTALRISQQHKAPLLTFAVLPHNMVLTLQETPHFNTIWK